MLHQHEMEYPIKSTPCFDNAVEIAPRIFWARLPLPFQLDHINVWLIQDDEGLSLIDTGIYGKESIEILQRLVQELSPNNGLSRIFVTHMHPDHVGAAGWMVANWGAEFWMSRLEYEQAQAAFTAVRGQMPKGVKAFYRGAGWSESAIDQYSEQYDDYSKLVHVIPEQYNLLEQGQVHHIGGYDWETITTDGHSPEHVSLFNKGLNLLISGDQILPRITSNVSVLPSAPGGNPLNGWLSSLERIKENVPADALVLPSHQECFVGLHIRVDQIISSHEKALIKLLDALHLPLRVVDTLEVLFRRRITEAEYFAYRLATGEALACLNYLISKDLVSLHLDSQGVGWYKRINY